MRRFVYVVVVLIIVFIGLLTGYGFYLNYASEKNIAFQVLNGQRLHLKGTTVHKGHLRCILKKPAIRLEARNFEDAIARNTGELTEVYVKQHEKVKKGQALARITNEDIEIKMSELEANLAKARAAVERYRISLERYQQLAALDAVSKEQLDDVKTNYKGAIEEEQSLLAKKKAVELQQSRLTIRAPIDGEVVMLYKKAGAYITEGMPIVMVADFSELIFKETMTDAETANILPLDQAWQLRIPEAQLRQRLYDGKLPPQNKGYEQTFEARVESIDPPLEVNGRIRMVSWAVKNDGRFLEPRNYEQVRLEGRRIHEGLIIPKAALDENGKGLVYVVNSENRLVARNIYIGVQNDDEVEVRDGLSEGETVIVSSQDGLRPGIEVEVEMLGEEK